MQTTVKLTLFLMILAVATACTSSPVADYNDQITRAKHAWAGDWHAEWQIEWTGDPVRGPLVAEIWHAADGRLRIETIEGPADGLSGLTLVNDGDSVWLYNLRQEQVISGSKDQVRIPLASDALDAIDWLLLEMGNATVKVSGHDRLESGPTTRLSFTTPAGDQATIWLDEKTGMPARVELSSAEWGEATFATRNIYTSQHQNPALFVFP